MADVNTAIYQPLQAPQQQQLGPLQVLQMIGQLNSNKLFQQEFQARQAIGQAYQDNTGPNGEINTPGLRTQIGQTGGFHAGEGLSQATANSASDAGLKSTYQTILRQTFGQLATKPVITDQDISTAKADAARQGVPGAFIQDYAATIPMGGRKGALKDWAVSQSNLARGPEAISAPVTVQSPQGQSVQYPEGMASRVRASGGLPTSLPPGVPESFAEGQKSLVADQKASAGTLANLRNLDIALPFVQKLSDPNFGPGSPEYAKLRASAATAGIIDPKASDVTIRQELGKYLMKYATLAQNSGRSDQALAAAVGSNPNLDLTQPANLALIKNQIALDKMDAAMPKLFKLEHPAQEDAAQYNSYKSDYYNKFDRRVFSYANLTPAERRGLVQSLGPKNSPAYQKFNNTYQIAKKAGIIVPETQQ